MGIGKKQESGGEPISDEDKATLSLWKTVLNWEKLPIFGEIQKLPYDDSYSSNYFVSDGIRKLERDLLFSLLYDDEHDDTRIIGDPGIGKTTFLYYIRKKYEKENVTNTFIEIFHVNKAIVNNKLIVEELIRYIKEAMGRFYHASNQEIKYNEFETSLSSDKVKLNKLVDYYINNKSQFRKRMILIIDSVDTVDYENVILDLVMQIFSHFQLASIKRWFVIRESTYIRYSPSVAKQIESFFPVSINFPQVCLADIVAHKISYVGSKAKNPFSSKLCDTVEKLKNKSLRESLGFLKVLLRDTSPGKFNSSTDELVLQNYFDKVAVKTIIHNNKLLNIHNPLFNTIGVYPVLQDVLGVVRIYGVIDAVFYTALENVRKNRISGLRQIFDIVIKESDYEQALYSLEKLGLIYLQKDYRGKKYVATQHAKWVLMYSHTEIYLNECKSLNNIIGEADDNEIYWKLASKEVNYSAYVYDEIFIRK